MTKEGLRPDGTKVHLMFYVCCLKKKLGDSIVPSMVLPQVTRNGLTDEAHLAVLARRMYKKGNPADV